MECETTATFIGHRDCTALERSRIESGIQQLISAGVTDFLCGGMGDFDRICAGIVYHLKPAYQQIQCHLVIPYLTFRVGYAEYFDSVIYPEGFERYHFKAAIPARNRYLVDHSAHALCYITHDWGGAAKTYAMAVKNGLSIINLGNALL